MDTPQQFDRRNPEREPLRRLFWEGLNSQNRRDFHSAEHWFRKVVEMEPAFSDGWCNLGGALRELERREESLEAVQKALALDPANTAARCNLGILKLDMRQPLESLAIFQALIKDAPECYLAHFHLGGAFVLLDRWEEALAAEINAVRLAPDFSLPYSNLGFVLMKLGRLDESEMAFLKALKLEPGQASASWNLAYVRLLMNRWEEAWSTFHYRLKMRDGLPSSRAFTQPEWRGEPFAGKRLLVWAEQGYGDTLMFLRLLLDVKARGGEVIFQVQPALLPLLREIPGVDCLVGEGEETPPFDWQVPLLSLPAALKLRRDSLADVVPYLETPGELPLDLHEKLQNIGDKVRIGLAWTGNPAHQEQARRSIQPSLFDRLTDLGNIQWFSLQKYPKGVTPYPLPLALKAVDLDDVMTDFAATAWAVRAMDLVISVDTVIAHLAGALGIPTFLLLPFSPDWRWGQTGETTPWYPTMRIYRQEKPGDWDGVIRKVASDLLG